MKTTIIIIVCFMVHLNVISQAGKEHFILASQKADAGDYNGAIDGFTKSIALEPNLAEAYYNRGLSKSGLKDYTGAIADIKKAMNLKPTLSATGYSDIGLYKYYMDDFKGSIADCAKAIELNPNLAAAYTNRALAKRSLKLEFCSDLKKARDMGEKQAIKYYHLDCE
jgi:tetratricopeptide (TPR) repeat protein